MTYTGFVNTSYFSTRGSMEGHLFSYMKIKYFLFLFFEQTSCSAQVQSLFTPRDLSLTPGFLVVWLPGQRRVPFTSAGAEPGEHGSSLRVHPCHQHHPSDRPPHPAEWVRRSFDTFSWQHGSRCLQLTWLVVEAFLTYLCWLAVSRDVV